jgi:asparagine synthase (glutamine-hydrolysing)
VGQIAERFPDRLPELMRLLPPFGVVASDSLQGISMLADSMGFRPMYHTAVGAQPCALSTSALLVGRAIQADLDLRAVAIQSRLGWQLGQRTLWAGVTKLAPGEIAHLTVDGVRVTSATEQPGPPISLGAAVKAAARVLRETMSALLDDHPDAVLQLTGGQDSRLLLSAVEPKRRRGLAAMTLGVTGSADATVASALAQRCGLLHEVHPLGDVTGLTPADAWELCSTAAVRLDGMADPIALAALSLAERQFSQGVRISGLGGEVARGFYYLGRIDDRPVTRRAAHRLGAWRMFVNEAVEPGLLTAEFAAWAETTADTDLFESLRRAGPQWFRATDELYLRHRMQRWAGLTDAAVGYQRIVLNPMLDHEFLSIAARLAPVDKASSRFLACLQMELDDELGRIPLDNRPAPFAYANPGPRAVLQGAAADGRRLVGKVRQRLRRGNRPPAGGVQLAAKVVEHWRDRPELLDGLSRMSMFSSRWMEQMLTGELEPRATSVAFITNLVTTWNAVPTTGDTERGAGV